MKKTMTFIVFALFVANAHAASTNATATATVTDGLTVVETQSISFGSFSAGATSGTITQSGATTGGVTLVSAGHQNGLLITGTPGANVNISHSPTVVLSNGTDSMTADLVLPAAVGNPVLLPPVGFIGAGQKGFFIDGTLHVNANQASGNYTGTYTVNVNY